MANLVTFLRAHGIVTLTLRHKYTEKKVKAYSIEELRALNAASTDEEFQIWQFFLGTGFREDEAAHACDTDVDFRMKTIGVLEKRQWNWKPKDKEERTVPIPDALIELLKVRKSMHPDGWLIFPNTEGTRLAFRASSIMFFSCASSLRGSSMWPFDSVAGSGRCNQLLSIEKTF